MNHLLPQVVELRATGKTYPQIGASLSIHAGTARRILLRAFRAGKISREEAGFDYRFGITVPGRKLSKEDYDNKFLERVFANSKRDDVTGCLNWQGFCGHGGYGMTNYRSDCRRVHRIVFQILNGELPLEIDVCHTCDNRTCIEPAHLWAGTRKENLVDCLVKKRHFYSTKTHCKHGHEFNEANTRIVTTPVGFGRQCRACKRVILRIKAGWSREEAEATAMQPIPPGAKTKRRYRAGMFQATKGAAQGE